MSTPEFNALKDDHRSELVAPLTTTPTTAATAYQHGRLNAEQLTRQPELDQLPASTRRVQPLNDFLGQTRARAAVETALSLPFDGYNIFAVGTGGLGKRTMLKRLLNQHAAEMPTPNDWVYVNNFQDARRPIALALIAGEAPKFKKAMHQLWEKLFKQLDRTFSADSYHTRIESIRQQASQVQQNALLALTQEGEALNLMLVSDQEEHHFVPAQLRDQAEATPIELDNI
ncbi:MAG: Lon-like protease helical domain-containing protein, partial [Moraxellaceae bacterium]